VFSAAWMPFFAYVLAILTLVVPAVREALPIFILLTVVLIVGGFTFGAIAYIRNSLGVVASTVEDLKVRKAMRRSKFLVSGHKGRVFGILLLTGALRMVAGVAQGIAGFFVGLSHGAIKVAMEAIALMLTFVTTAMVVPVAAIALCLFYIDERVRKEGFDLEVLMSRATPSEPSGPDELPSPFNSELV